MTKLKQGRIRLKIKPQLSTYKLLIPAAIAAGLLTGCFSIGGTGDGPPSYHVDAADIPNAVPRKLPRSKYGNPKSYVVFGHRYFVRNSAKGYDQRGIASWYGTKFHEKRTSSGEPYNMLAMTAAHKTLPLPTFVRVTNLENGRWIIVKVNDRGPFAPGRIIDLSYVAAKKLNMLKTGTAMVEVKALTPGQPMVTPTTRFADNLQREPNTPLGHKPKLYLQAGAFSSKQNAEARANALRNLTTRHVAIRQVFSRGRTLYKVQVGPLVNVQESDGLSQRIENAGITHPVPVVS